MGEVVQTASPFVFFEEQTVKVVSVNVGLPQALIVKDRVIESAICKRPVAGPVKITHTNLAGDLQGEIRHRGQKRAVSAYPSEHYVFWRAELSEPELAFGAFGENLTTEGVVDQDVFIGDRWQVGSAVLTVTQPRIPCFKLAARFNRDDIIERVLNARRQGFFFAVEQEGEVEAGDSIRLIDRNPKSISVVDLTSLYLGRSTEEQLLQRAMDLDLPTKWKAKFAQRAAAGLSPSR